MNLREIYSNVCVQLGGKIPYALYFSALTRVLKRINIQAEKETAMRDITGEGDWELTIDLDEEEIDLDERIIGESRWAESVVWDSVNNAVRLPRNYAKILAVYCDDEIMEAVPYETLKASDGTELYYTNVSNHLYFNKDYSASTEKITVKVRLDYDLPSFTDGEYEGLPESAESMIINGIMSVLYTQPSLYDVNQLTLYRQQFEQDLLTFNQDVLRKEVHEHYLPNYTY